MKVAGIKNVAAVVKSAVAPKATSTLKVASAINAAAMWKATATP
jgi:hypothetical protein